MVRLMIHVTSEMLAKLTAEATKTNRSAAFLIREAVAAQYKIPKERRHADKPESRHTAA